MSARSKPRPPASAVATPPSATISPAGRERLIAVAIVLAVFLAYQPAWRAGFVWDDDAHVPRPDLQSLAGLGRIWTEVGATQQYYPLLFSSFWVQHQFFGGDAGGYHLVNLALHALCAVLFGFLLRRLRVPGAWLAAGVFALHPVCVESVAWLTEQKNTFSTALYLGAALVYLRFEERRAFRTYLAASALFVAALLAKTPTATLPAALLVVFWWQRGRLEWRRDVLPLVPWFIIAVPDGLFNAWVERRYIGAEGANFALSLTERALVAGRAAWFYFGKLLWPADLVFIYQRWSLDATAAGQWIFPVTAVAAVAGLWLLRRRTRAPLAAALVFLGTAFPTLGFFNVYAFLFSFVTDHWLYLPSLAVIAAVCGGLATAVPSTRWTRVAAVAAVALLGGLSWRQARLYADAATLYQATLARNPGCWLAHVNLGNEFFATRHYADAEAQYREGLRLRPAYSTVHYDLATVLAVTGRVAEAIPEFREALRLKPNYSKAENNLGVALTRIGEDREAVAHFAAAVRLDPNFAEAHYHYGLMLLQDGKDAGARKQFDETLRIQPDHPGARLQLQRMAAGP